MFSICFIKLEDEINVNTTLRMTIANRRVISKRQSTHLDEVLELYERLNENKISCGLLSVYVILRLTEGFMLAYVLHKALHSMILYFL